MPDRRVDEDAAFHCAFCKNGVVVFESQHIFPEIDSPDIFGCDPTSRTEPTCSTGGVLLVPHPAPNWIGRYSHPMIQAERNVQNAVPDSAICATCLLENKTIGKLIELRTLKVAVTLEKRNQKS